MPFIALVVLLATCLPFVAEGQERGSAADVYRIGPEDVLRITVWKNEALSGTVPVRPDGKISMPLIDNVQAAGLTPLELRAVLTEKLAQFIPSPEVSVIVSDVRSLQVSVIGEVARAGRYEIKSWATVLDALALAGRFKRPLMWDGLFMPSGKPFPP